MHSTRVFITAVVFVTSCKDVSTESANDLQRLYKDKVLPNNPNIRPVKNQSDVLNVSLNFNLLSINNFDEVLEKLSFTAWLSVWWRDELLVWNKEEYGDAENLWPEFDKIWKPKIAVKNTVDELRHLAVKKNNILKITSKGLVTWAPGSAFNTHCDVDTSNFPFDKQLCQVELIVWGHDLTYVDLYPGSQHVGLNMYMENGEWVITSSSIQRTIQIPERSEIPVLVVSIHLKRRPIFIVISVVIPVSVLAILSVFAFAIPLNSGDKISFSVTILLAFGVMMTFILETLPKTSKNTSSLVIYLIVNTTIGALFVCLSVLLTNLHHRNENLRPVPRWLVKLSKLLERVLKLKGNISCRKNMDEPKYESSKLKMNVKSKSEDNSWKDIADDDITWKYISNVLDAAIFWICFPAMILLFVAFTSMLYTNN